MKTGHRTGFPFQFCNFFKKDRSKSLFASGHASSSFNITIMKEKQNNPVTRKRFMLSGLGILSLIAAFKLWRFSGAKRPVKTVKMLTQDGKLVEVDVSNIPPEKKKITNTQLQNWITKKPNS
jgi:hypothetical protein